MTEHHNRRKNHIFGIAFDISVKWLLIIIVMGLVQFGMFWEQFRDLNNKVQQMINDMHITASASQALIIKDAQQDSELSRLGADMADVKARLERR